MYSDPANPASPPGQQPAAAAADAAAVALPDPPPPGGGGGEAAGGGTLPFLPTLPPDPAPHFVAANPAPASPAADFSTSPKGEVRPQAGVGAPAFPPVSSTASLPLPSPSNPQSQIQNPQSEAPNFQRPGRPTVPLTFNPIINDEANILAAIARGDRTIPDLAEEHGTTVSNFALWLQREDIQHKLANLATAGATLTRIAAVNQLPKAVSALSFQIDGYIFDRAHNLIKPGLDADRIAATRDANVRKAAHLLLRLAKFDPNQPVYRRRERSPADSSTLSPQGSAKRGEEASAQHEPVRGIFSNLRHADVVMSGNASETEETLLLPSTHAPLPDIIDLCFDTLAAIAPESSRTPERETRSPISALTSDIPLPTSEFEPDPDTPANSTGPP